MCAIICGSGFFLFLYAGTGISSIRGDLSRVSTVGVGDNMAGDTGYSGCSLDIRQTLRVFYDGDPGHHEGQADVQQPDGVVVEHDADDPAQEQEQHGEH